MVGVLGVVVVTVADSVVGMDPIVALIGQLMFTLLACQTQLLLAYRRYSAQRRRAAARILFQDSVSTVAWTRSRIRRRQRFQHWFLLAQMEEPRQHWVYPRSTDWWENIVLVHWDDRRWMRRFRMSKRTFIDLVEALRPRLQRQNTSLRSAISVERRVAVAIWWLASGTSYQVASDLFGIGKSTVASAVVEFCLAVEVELLSKTVSFGRAIGQIMDGFRRMGFPHCVGAIDGTHIPICAPGGRPDQYGNRKNYSSILLQGTVDHRGRFVDAEVGWSGKNHDAFVFAHSAFCVAMDSGSLIPGNPFMVVDGVRIPPVVIADGAYPMRRWLMKPYGRTATTQAQKMFDTRLSRARNVVECCFGRLKARWRCLSHRLQVREHNVIAVVTACVVLHNLCESRGHPITGRGAAPETILVSHGEGQELTTHHRHLAEGKVVRDALAKYMGLDSTS
ncbi:uncharacterized protein LOC129344072 [Eublepharis macularius]|uniref:Uncharacterized protein LOC129324891 n=1 Tax=Eublepharis macularius TaxID=481883 RepID=A0AA97JTU4_EUBMA|nr:uncharacterized protein LOC129324891 [Eublepharis macularius]XP_054829700.1 uncharacterized protein LOC129325811 [Eublepharis macularius]XP_054830600.1 uncharacterized protein LOC129326458 [Eublepharis macularius]XP_054830685.1 uncharacterized protein LOC129326514 [Eublepharis macularius]XP_054837988.1 uncharacterized protein LOC129331448 [Eublepharis macularius]XP_054839627.1 uncharacterized protein LOC129332491 [Eublepharis macularius]XP_054845203.1 uncharacterized protein LOC129336179 [